MTVAVPGAELVRRVMDTMEAPEIAAVVLQPVHPIIEDDADDRRGDRGHQAADRARDDGPRRQPILDPDHGQGLERAVRQDRRADDEQGDAEARADDPEAETPQPRPEGAGIRRPHPFERHADRRRKEQGQSDVREALQE